MGVKWFSFAWIWSKAAELLAVVGEEFVRHFCQNMLLTHFVRTLYILYLLWMPLNNRARRVRNSKNNSLRPLVLPCVKRFIIVFLNINNLWRLYPFCCSYFLASRCANYAQTSHVCCKKTLCSFNLNWKSLKTKRFFQFEMKQNQLMKKRKTNGRSEIIRLDADLMKKINRQKRSSVQVVSLVWEILWICSARQK